MSGRSATSSVPAPLRVLLTFPYAFGKTGVGRTALEQVNALAELGHTVLVSAPLAVPDAVVAPGVRVVETRKIAGRRVPGRLVRFRGLGARLHDVRTKALLRREHARAPIDVLHAWPLSGHRTMAAAKRLGVAVVREVPNTHTAYAYDVVEREAASLGITIPPGNSHERDDAHLAAEEREWAIADAMLVPSEPSAESFRERGFAPERLVRHRYGCTVPADVPSRRAHGGLQALFLGAAEPRKGLHHALTAWRDSTASAAGTFRIAGRFMPGYREALGELLETRGVEVLGFADDPSALLAQADVLLLPSVEEGSAIVTYEAQAVGTVPLVSREAGALLDDNVHGLVHAAGDVDTLRAHLDAVDQDRDLLTRLSQAALRDRERLSWRSAGVVLEAAYAHVIAAHGRRTRATP